jgi:PAS domain S-box-containing protein
VFRSIKTKVLFAQSGIVLLACVTLGLFTYFLMINSLRKSQQAHVEHIAQDNADYMSSLIKRKGEEFEKIANGDAVADYRKTGEYKPLIEYFGRFMQEFPTLAYVGKDGSEELKLVNGKLAEKLSNISKTTIFEEATWETNKVFALLSTRDDNPNEACMEFTFCRRDFFDDFVGFIAGKIPLSDIVSDIQKFKFGETGFVMLIDDQGTILSHPQKDKILQKVTVGTKRTEQIITQAKAMKPGFGRATILGVDGYVTYSPVEGRNWTIIAILPYKEFIIAPNKLRNTAIIVSSAILIIGVLISSILSANITNPISKLAAVTGFVAEGDLSQRVDISSKDEIGALGQSFNRMTADLAASVNNLTKEITVRKKAEAALRKSEERFKQVAENAGEWIWEVNAEGLYTYSNPIVEEILGYKPEEIVRKKYFYDFFAPDVKEELKKAALNAFAAKESFKGFINPNVHKNGNAVILETNGSQVVDDEGKLCGYRGADIDITERKKAEEKQAQLLKELENANRELKDLVYIASHDLKTPLRGITTLAEWLSTDYADKLGEQGKEQIGLLLRRAKRMHNLIEGILQYSKIGRVKESQAVMNLNKVVADVIDMIAPPENITITVENELPTIESEPTRIAQVFQNLISNAINYMDKPQGQIKIGCVEENGFWKFNVTDNGPGIEERHFEKIFQIFQTLASRDDLKSTGIGLTITRKIVELYGGKIWIESKVGEGSTFFFTLPKQEMGVKDAKLEANIACGR